MAEGLRPVTALGYVAAALAVAVTVVGGATRDGYDHAAQLISELGQRGGPHGVAVSLLGFLVIGLLVLAFTVLAVRDVRARRLLAVGIGIVGLSIAVGYGVSGLARCEAGCPTDGDWQQSVHNAVGYVEYGGAPLGMLLTAIAVRRDRTWRIVTAWSAIAFVAFLAIAPLVEEESRRGSRGTLQRVLEGLLFGWVALVAHRLGQDTTEDQA